MAAKLVFSSYCRYFKSLQNGCCHTIIIKRMITCKASNFNIYLHRNAKIRKSKKLHDPYAALTRYSFSIDVHKNYYEILGVKKNATAKEIRCAYLKLSKIWHPDSHSKECDKKYANGKFVEISESYKILYNKDTRKKYNDLRKQYESILVTTNDSLKSNPPKPSKSASKSSSQSSSESEWKAYESPKNGSSNNGYSNDDSWILSKEKKEEYRRRMLAEWDYIWEQEAEKEDKLRKSKKTHKWSMNL